MDWMLLTELSSMFCGPWHPTVPPVDAGPAAELAGPAGLVKPTELAELAEADLWIARQAYEFMAARALCERCGARLGRKVSVAALQLEQLERAVAVGARCRGWRRHRHTALVSRGRDGLRFGTLAPS
jgi:hypothetical protein